MTFNRRLRVAALTVWLIGGAFLLGCTAAAPQTEVAAPGGETLLLTLESTAWQNVYHDQNPQTLLREWVPTAETPAAWSRKLTLQAALRGPDRPVKTGEQFEAVKRGVQQRCPDAAWQVYEQDNDNILYQWRTADCPGIGARHEIVRSFISARNRVRLSYAGRVAVLPQAELRVWLERLRSATVVAH